MSLHRLIGLVPTEETPEALEVMRLSMLDWLACGRAGVGEPVARATRGLALSEAGTAQAHLFGGGQVPARAAALVNGATSHALDYDDTHFAHIGHPSVAVVSAALAMGELTGASLSAVVVAALRGCELSIRTGLRLGRGHYQVGFHQTATAGALGATYAAALLAHVDPTAHGVALSLATTRAAGLKSQFGTDGKPYNAGIAAATGVEAALLAGAMTASRDPLEGVNGFLATHHADGTWDQPDGWLMSDVSHKFHACCHGLHATLEALSGIKAEGIARVIVTTHPRWMTVCNIAAPTTGLEAKFSYAQVVAMALLGRDTARIASYTDAVTQDPAIQALRARVDVAADPALSETEAQVTLHLSDGSTRALHHDLSAPRPLADRRDKVQAKAASLIGAKRAETAWSVLNTPDATASAFAALLS